MQRERETYALRMCSPELYKLMMGNQGEFPERSRVAFKMGCTDPLPDTREKGDMEAE